MTDRAENRRWRELVIIIIVAALILMLSACQSAENGNTSAIPDNSMAQRSEEPETSGGMPEDADVIPESEETGMDYDFSLFTNVEITGVDISALNEDELSVLYTSAQYCQAMTDADIDKMREIVSEDMTFTHMSGMTQSREEYFADIGKGRLNYLTIGIENPNITVDGNVAEITYTSVLNANAYGVRGTYRMTGTHRYERWDGEWTAVNR